MKGALTILHVNGVGMGFISAQAERAGSEITRIDPAADSRAGQNPQEWKMRTILSLSIAAALAVGCVGEANAQAAKIIGLGIGAVIGKMAGEAAGKAASKLTPEEKAKYVRENRPTMDTALDKVMDDLRKTFPKKIEEDGETYWITNATRKGDWLNYVYVWSEEYEAADADQLAKGKAIVIKNACVDSIALKVLMDGGYGLSYWYYNPDRKTLTANVKVTAADCAK